MFLLFVTGGKFAAGVVNTDGNLSTTQAELVAKFAAGVVDTGGKFAAGVIDTGGNICHQCLATGVVDTDGAP